MDIEDLDDIWVSRRTPVISGTTKSVSGMAAVRIAAARSPRRRCLSMLA
jgi:hypothetical protein